MAIYDLTTTIEGAKTITNLAMARTAVFTNMEAPIKGVYTHGAGQLALLQHNMETPIYGHKYYGRCYQKAPAGHFWNDARFEYYAEDVAGTGLMTFGVMQPTNNEWKMLSSIQTLTGTPSTKTWVLRSFVSNGNTDSYRKEILIVDLTETYGAGNEPTREWCDKNIPFFEGSLTILPDLQEGDVINCPYSGAKKGVMLPIGKYTLETWGAQGGSYNSSYAAGGKGGYAKGTLFAKEPVGLISYAGGQGSAYTTSTYTSQGGGGFNGGGGAGYRGGGGGGASDIRIGYDSLYARALVAGGGGGAYSYNSTYKAAGGVGGGRRGGTGVNYSSSYYIFVGFGGSESVGGEAGGNNTQGNYNGKSGTFGQGGNTGYKYNSTSYYSAGAGGGGWYGGGGAANYSSSSRNRAAGGGGGSGYAYTKEAEPHYPSGCLLDTKDYLTDIEILDGAKSFLDIDGTTTVTGRSGNGYCKITILQKGNIGKKTKIENTNCELFNIGTNLVNEAWLGNQCIYPRPGEIALDFNNLEQLENYLVLYDNGNECTNITGGWLTQTNGTNGAVTKNTNYIRLHSYRGCIYTNNTINLAPYDVAYIDMNTLGRTTTAYKSQMGGAFDSPTFNAAYPQNPTASFFQENYNRSAAGRMSLYREIIETTTNNKSVWLFSDDGDGKGYIDVYFYALLKSDNWKRLCSTSNIKDSYGTILELLSDMAGLNQIFNIDRSVEYMAKQCTGTFMAQAVESNNFIDALEDSPYKNKIVNNEHWNKFLTRAVPFVPDNTVCLLHFNEDLEDEIKINQISCYDSSLCNFTEGKFSKSISFAGDNYLQMPLTERTILGTNDFTIAGWFKMDTLSQATFWSYCYYVNSTYNWQGIQVWYNTSNGICMSCDLGEQTTKNRLNTGTTLTAGVWYHIALVRKNGTLTLYLNGTSIGTLAANGTVYQNPSAQWHIGATNPRDSESGGERLIGEVDEFIIVNGTALWSTTFTPPRRQYLKISS